MKISVVQRPCQVPPDLIKQKSTLRPRGRLHHLDVPWGRKEHWNLVMKRSCPLPPPVPLPIRNHTEDLVNTNKAEGLINWAGGPSSGRAAPGRTGRVAHPAISKV